VPQSASDSHLEDDDNVDSEALVSLLTLLFVFEESSPFLDLVSFTPDSFLN